MYKYGGHFFYLNQGCFIPVSKITEKLWKNFFYEFTEVVLSNKLIWSDLIAWDCHHCRRHKLYYGISHDGEGRKDYLQRRVVIQPEDRYHLPLLTSWQHGWQIAHNEELFDRPSHRRTSRIKESFFSRTGVPGLNLDHPEVPTMTTETHWSTTCSFGPAHFGL